MSGYVYQPKGRAGEYAEWACNLYRGCPHGCAYCYVPDVLRRTGMTRYQFHRDISVRKDVLKGVERDLRNVPAGSTIHLCFTCDPYPNLSGLEYSTMRAILEAHPTRRTIELIKDAGYHVQILTKGGDRETSMPDFDLLGAADWFGVTLTMDNGADSRLWEPHAATPLERVWLLKAAHSWDVKTWVSLEPVIYPEQSLNILRVALEVVPLDLVKVGPLNYSEKLPKWLRQTLPESVDWRAFVDEVERLCGSTTEVYLKEDMREKLE